MKPGGVTTPFLKSFKYAVNGIAECFRQGKNVKVQSAVAVLVVVLGFALGIAPWEWCAVLICCGAVIGGECLNTAIEDAVDLACDHIDPLAKAAKDLAAGGVLVFSLASVFVGCIVFVPKILALLGW